MLEGWALILNHPPLKQMVDLQDILFDDGHLVAGDQYPIAILGVGSKCSRQDAVVVQTESDGQIEAISHYHAENPTAEQCQRHECGGLQLELQMQAAKHRCTSSNFSLLWHMHLGALKSHESCLRHLPIFGYPTMPCWKLSPHRKALVVIAKQLKFAKNW